jgi:hypothetical protein
MAGDAPERTAGPGDRIAPSLALGAWLQILCKRNQTTRSVMSNIPATPQNQPHPNSRPDPSAEQGQPAVVALDLKRIDKGAVYGTVTLWIPRWKVRFYEVLWGRRQSGQEWLQLPERSWTGQNGTRHTKLIGWDDDETTRRFEKAALDAIHRLVAQTPR